MKKKSPPKLQIGIVSLTLILVMALPATVIAATISTIDKYAWSESAGWLNFNSSYGEVTVYETHLAGYVWGENIGWIKLGAESGGPYANATVENWGVNKDAAGNLSGYAWSETSGWINFNPTYGGVTINPSTHEFSGYAWSENIGWVHFNHPTLYKVIAINDAPVNDVMPTINGIAAFGNSLNIAVGTWTDVDGDIPSYSYQWKANGINIEGATFSTFALTVAQAHAVISCVITADDGNGGITSVTTAGVPVSNSAPVFTGTPTIIGVPAAGESLGLIDIGVSDADGDMVTLSYQWEADGVAVAGATSATCPLTREQAGKMVACFLLADDGYGGATSITTSAVVVKKSFPWQLLLPALVSPNKVIMGDE